MALPSAAKPSRRRDVALALTAAWLAAFSAAVSGEPPAPAAPPGSATSSPAATVPTDARQQQFEILTQAVTALCQEIAQNNTRSEALTEEKERLRARVASLRRELSATQDEDERLRSKAQALEKQLREVGATLPETRSEQPRRGDVSAETVPPAKRVASKPGGGTVANSMPRPEPTGSDGIYHVVAPGENLFRIGVAYGVDYRDLAKANRIDDPGHIEIGQRILIPRAAR